MSRERELKLAVGDLAALRRRLQAQGAVLLNRETFEDNLVWDRGGELRAAACLLRLRSDEGGATLTFKGPASFEAGVKVRTEHETGVRDADATAEILEAIGYAVARRYQKYREQWRLVDVVIALDRTPMGDFVEFEGYRAAEAAQLCGYDPSAALEKDYLALYDAYRRDYPAAPENMVFEPPEQADG